jgi:hypothetical protein
VLNIFNLIGSGVMASIVGNNKAFEKGLVFLYVGGSRHCLCTDSLAQKLLLLGLGLWSLWLPHDSCISVTYDFSCEVTYPVGDYNTRAFERSRFGE